MTTPELSSDQFGAKPAVLRCSRCGKFVDWEDAQLQIVCTCRPHLELPPVLVREATDADRLAARELIQRDFGRTKIVAFGEVMDIDQMPALVAVMQADPSGVLAYRLLGDALQIVALATDPMWQRSGGGSASSWSIGTVRASPVKASSRNACRWGTPMGSRPRR